MYGFDARLVSFALACLFRFVSIFLLKEKQVMMILLQPKTRDEREEEMETRTQFMKSITRGQASFRSSTL